MYRLFLCKTWRKFGSMRVWEAHLKIHQHAWLIFETQIRPLCFPINWQILTFTSFSYKSLLNFPIGYLVTKYNDMVKELSKPKSRLLNFYSQYMNKIQCSKITIVRKTGSFVMPYLMQFDELFWMSPKLRGRILTQPTHFLPQ